MYLRREDGGPFDLVRLDYRLTQPGAANLLIGTNYNPAQPITQQLTAFPITANANFQTTSPPGFSNVTQLFLAWQLTETTSDTGTLDNIVLNIPAGSCSQSQPGGVVASHAGLADPASEGWTAEGPAVDVALGPVVNDLGFDAFAIDDNASSTEAWRAYTRALTPDEMCWARTTGFRLRSRLRVVNTPDTPDGSLTLSFFDSLNLFELRVGSALNNDPIVGLSGPNITLTGLGGGYHLYEMVYDPVSRTVDLFVDGVERLSNRAGTVSQVRSSKLSFGSPASGGGSLGEGRYALVEFELPTRCMNGLDDDDDGLVDFPNDPGCDSPNDDSERSAALVCDDGLDNDGDGAIDYPADSGCRDPYDSTETGATTVPAASPAMRGLLGLALAVLGGYVARRSQLRSQRSEV
jgi:hypothetical protein